MYLVYFKDDETVSISSECDIVEDCSLLKVGSLCHMKFKIFEATTVTCGNKLIISHDIDCYAAKRV